jgi:hypothetical protein
VLPLARRGAVTAFAVLALAVGTLSGCGGADSQTRCGLDGCTVTFPRDGTAAVSILGVEARLLGVDGGVARLEVAGQTVTVPVGEQTTAEGFTVGVERVTDTEVVVRVSR